MYKLPRMNHDELHKVLKTQILCRIAFNDVHHPYIAPFQYVFLNDSIYFQFTNYGRKMRLLNRDNRVCVEIENYTSDLSQYCFIVIRGKLETISDPDERDNVINYIAQTGKNKISSQFLAAHGLTLDKTWNSYTSEKPFLILKLVDIVEMFGLKSPN